MWRINYSLVNKICDAESHFVQISFDFAVIRSLIFLDQADPLELKCSLMGCTEHFLKCRGKVARRGSGEMSLAGRVDCEAVSQ